MAWRIVKQPNGKYARFSDVVDDFTDYDMDESQALELCRNLAGERLAQEKLQSANRSPMRFEESIETVALIHGEGTARERRFQLTEERDD